MNHIRKTASSTFAEGVLDLNSDIPEFLKDQINARNLRQIVTGLNKELLQGTPKERDQAQRALERLGFI